LKRYRYKNKFFSWIFLEYIFVFLKYEVQREHVSRSIIFYILFLKYHRKTFSISKLFN
jgi:hypothetical protein